MEAHQVTKRTLNKHQSIMALHKQGLGSTTISKRLGIPRSTVRGHISSSGTTIVRQSPDDNRMRGLEQAIESYKAKAEYSLRTSKAWEAENIALREQVAQLTNLDRDPSIHKLHIPQHHQSSTAVMVLSDLHIEERVKQGDIAGLSAEFSPSIAKRRLSACFANGLTLTSQQAQHTKINTLVCALLGDNLSGNIHEDLAESNHLSPMESLDWLFDNLCSGLDHLLGHSDLRIIVPCCYGNHGRSTRKKRVATGAETSYEWLLYRMMAKRYQGNKRIQFQIATSDLLLTKLGNYTIRFTHGDCIGYGGGIGGISIPIIKKIHRWDSIAKADLTVMGHWHSLQWAGNYVVNGSLIGPSAYGQSIGACERPQQAFFLVDQKHGMTVRAPIFTE